MEPAASHDACNKAGGASRDCSSLVGRPALTRTPPLLLTSEPEPALMGWAELTAAPMGSVPLDPICVRPAYRVVTPQRSAVYSRSVYSSLLLCTSALNLIEVAGISIT